MKTKARVLYVSFFVSLFLSGSAHSADINALMGTVCHKVSGDRARDYCMRIWQYDKWSTLPMWKKSCEEIRSIMLERGFDEAEIVDTPADGRSKAGTWTNPLGWDVKQATLEIIEPSNLPEEFRYLSNYLDNPTSLGCWSAPTTPEGIEADLVIVEGSGEEALKAVDARRKIILVSSDSRGMKRYMDRYGVLGIVSDQIESHSEDSVTANCWLNGWSDLPGGWLMTDYDSKNNICFSISQKKSNYLRNLIRQGKTVKVRAKVDSRYYTDDTLPYVTGYIRGAGPEGEVVLIGGHNHEWGASDNSSGCAAALEAAGTLNDLIDAGVLPRPRRGIRLWFGSEIYGSLAFAEHNLERLNTKTVASIMCDDGGGNYDLLSSILIMVMNPNCTPSYTDALLAEISRRYYASYNPQRVFKTSTYKNADNLFCDPMIGAPSNWIYMSNVNDLHHNSKDTIDKIDPRSLRDVSIISALFLYYIADADYENLHFLAELCRNRGMELVLEKYADMNARLGAASDGVSLGKVLYDGTKTITYYTGLQKKTLYSIERIIPADRRSEAREYLSKYADKLNEFGSLMVKQFNAAVKEKAQAGSIRIVDYKEGDGQWEREAETIVPKRKYVGVISLQGIPVEEWVEVRSDPHWWGETTWASSSLWWCNGTRNLNEIKELCELEAGVPIHNFNLITYYRFLEKYKLVEFVR